MQVEDVGLHFGLKLVLQYDCMDDSKATAGPKVFTPANHTLSSYPW